MTPGAATVLRDPAAGPPPPADPQARRHEKAAVYELAALSARQRLNARSVRGLSTRSVAELLAEVGDRRRFTTRGFARFHGTAPLPASTAEGPGEPIRHRYNPGGTRRVNAILHRMGVTQLLELRAQTIYAKRPARATPTRGAVHPQARPQRRHRDLERSARPCPLAA